MGFLDKVKDSASAAAAATKEAAQKGQAKLDEIQAKKAADTLLRDLGALTYGQATGRGSPTADADVGRLTAALQRHEDEHGPIDLSLESGSPGAPPAASPPGNGASPPPPKAQTL